MNTKMKLFLVGILAGGISYWFNNYNEYLLLGVNIHYIMFINSILFSFIVTYYLNSNSNDSAAIISLGALTAYIIRILFDVVFIDRTSHNLLPFEIIMISLIVFPGTYLGAFGVKLVKRIKKIG